MGVDHICICDDCAIAPFTDRCKFEALVREIATTEDCPPELAFQLADEWREKALQLLGESS